mgnify:CR=1 FL=1
MKLDEIKKPIILMCVAALLIAVLIIIAGVTYSISSRSASPLFQCVKAYQDYENNVELFEAFSACGQDGLNN